MESPSIWRRHGYMKRVMIDAGGLAYYFVTGRVNGIGRTTMELIQALAARAGELPFEVMLYSQNMKGIGGRNLHTPFRCRHLYLPDRPQVNRLLACTPVKEWFTGYDLLHIPSNFAYVHRPDRCVVTIHDALFMKMQEQAFNHDKMRMEVPPFARACRHIITCSEASKRDIVETMHVEPEKVTVIYWGIKHDVFHPLQLAKEDIINELKEHYAAMPSDYFLSVSCNAERKRTHLLVEAYMELCKQRPVNDLVLVWGNPPQWLMQKINSSPARGRVHFVTGLGDDQLALLYNGAMAAFTLSSYEGFGLPLLEAMACGTPVATCGNSSLGEIAADAAIYMDEPVKESALAVMEQFENGSIDIEKYRQKGLTRAAEFTWQRTAAKTIEVYKHNLE